MYQTFCLMTRLSNALKVPKADVVLPFKVERTRMVEALGLMNLGARDKSIQ